MTRLDATFAADAGAAGLEPALALAVEHGVRLAATASVLVISDRAIDAARAPLPGLRLVARLHDAIVREGRRHQIGIVVDAGVWDVHQCALLLALGADAVCPWLGCLTAGVREANYLKGLRAGFVEVMSMVGVTPASAYCGAKLVEAVGLEPSFLAAEFPGVAGHLGGLGPDTLDAEWMAFHARAFSDAAVLADVGEFHYRSGGRPHASSPAMVRALHEVSGFREAKTVAAASDVDPGHAHDAGEAYARFSRAVSDRDPLTLIDLVRLRSAEPIRIEDVEPEEDVLWRFMVPGMSEGALSEPAHRAVARAMNILHRYCRAKFRRAGRPIPSGIGPVANSGEGGFDKSRLGTRDANRSIQYAGGRFTVTPAIAASADEAEVKFAQGAKPGKGGQLPGKKVSRRVAAQRGCEPGFELNLSASQSQPVLH